MPQGLQVRDPARETGRRCFVVVESDVQGSKGWRRQARPRACGLSAPKPWAGDSSDGQGGTETESEKTAFQFLETDPKAPAGKRLVLLALDVSVLEENSLHLPRARSLSPIRRRQTGLGRAGSAVRARQCPLHAQSWWSLQRWGPRATQRAQQTRVHQPGCLNMQQGAVHLASRLFLINCCSKDASLRIAF